MWLTGSASYVLDCVPDGPSRNKPTFQPVLSGNIPDRITDEGWDATQIENGGPGPGRRGLLLVRRRAAATEFIIVHQPFCGRKPDPLKLSREGDLLHIQGTDFRDEIELPFVKCRRV